MQTYHDVEVGQLYDVMIDHVRSQRLHNSLEYGFVQVQWNQLSIIFCDVREDPPQPESLLWFRISPGQPESLLIDPQFPLREHLLFVSYIPALHQLYILGDLSLARYQGFLELGFIQLCELETTDCLLYNSYPQEEEFVSDARLFANYQLPLFTHPEAAFSDFPLKTRLKALQYAFDDVVYGIPRSTPKETLYQVALRRYMCQKHRPMVFYYGCLLASLNQNFYNEFVQSEQARLYSLLQLFFDNECKRIQFVRAWFPSMLIVEQPLDNQFFGKPSGFEIISEHSYLPRLHERHTLKRPQAAYPGIYFRAPLVDAPSLINDMLLPVHLGQVCFTHYELEAFVDTQVEKAIRRQVNFFHHQCQLHYAERYLTPMLAQYQHTLSSVSQVEHAFRQANLKLDEPEIDQILTAFRGLITHPEAFLYRFVLPIAASLENIVNYADRFTVWPPARAMLANMGEAFYRQHPELQKLHQELVPDSYQTLLDYANRYWPPCMQKLASGRVGDKHMKYDERIAMSAQLRRFGYSEPQGTQLWHRLFMETDVYKESGEHNFMDTSQGSVIVYDYKGNKQANTGVSCRNWIARKFCPFTDIEELAAQTKCKEKFTELNPTYYLAFAVKSPRDYFFQAREAK